MRKVILLPVALVLLFLTGCATIRGMAEDVQSLGRGLKKTVSDEDDSRRR